jgi:secreted trypsin-like serine protease
MGNIKTIETGELSSLVSEIGESFSLNFNGAERSEGKWVINLTSAKRENNPDEEIEKDNLDDVYGPSSSGNTKKKKVKAFSLTEMIKGSKNDKLIENLQKIIGDKNAS